MPGEIEKSDSKVLYDMQMVEDVGQLVLRGYSNSNISEILHTTPFKVKGYKEEYYRIVRKQAEDDPYFLERIQENTIMFMKELADISKEAWETVNIATDNSMVTARNQALRLALDVTVKKAQMLQLLGAKTSTDADYVARLQKAERVNQMLSEVIRDVVSDCPRCSEMARLRLAEAFSMIEVFEEAEIVED